MSTTISSIAGSTGASAAYQAETKKAASAPAAEQTKAAGAASDVAAVYEKSSASAETGKAPYSVNKMSEADRNALVTQLKQEQANMMENFNKMVMDTISGQAKSFSIAAGSDAMWKFLADGNFTVDAATKAKAEEDISEDGYWGVKKTSERLFEFASALAGDDEETMKKMQDAIGQGFKEAGSVWGKDMPDITSKTRDATNKLFEDYYASKRDTEGVV